MARQGVPYHHATHLRVVDEQLKDVPADGETMGEVVMRGNNVMRGYFRDPEGSAAAFAGGWFHSGDLGVLHADGYIELRDRKKDIIISGGENISTIEVEHTVVKHPAVLECAVVAIGDFDNGERGLAALPGREDEFKESMQHALEYASVLNCDKLHVKPGDREIDPFDDGRGDRIRKASQTRLLLDALIAPGD